MVKPNKSLLVTLVWLTLGLAGAGIWTDVVGYSINLLPSDSAAGSGTFSRDAFLMGRLCVGIVLFIFATIIPRVQQTLVSLTAVVMSAATAALVIAYHQTLIEADLLASAGTLISSAGYTFIVWGFYVFFAQNIQTEQIVCSIAISLVLETALSILISLYMPAMPQMALVILLPFLVALCYFLSQRSYKDESERFIAEKRAEGFEKYALLVEVVLFTIILVFIRALSNVGIWGENRSNFTGMNELSVDELVIICSLILLMSYLVFILPRKRLPLLLRCILGFAVMLGGLQILAITSDIQFDVSFDSITTAVEIFAHLVRWMVIIECIRTISMPHYRVAGITNTFYVAVSLLWTHVLAQRQFVTSTFVMVIVYVFLLIVLLIFIRNTPHKNSTPWSRHFEESQAAAEAFAHQKGLSPRESQIFSLLIEGNKRHEIELRCELSEGTVKTHISNIYKKLDIHSKHDLLELYKQSLTDIEKRGA
ncbi:MAG: helix-turn-helix transcriptional regulator [Coriobacteriales bacterium]|jgi:DNA-binding CsgD family transcriptional regulator|nr:helix-turn-helix transcriptional regulator [Coriobacteriales bacterium]